MVGDERNLTWRMDNSEFQPRVFPILAREIFATVHSPAR